jgi:hypothetical protein
VPSSVALSAADQPSTSREISTARCRGRDERELDRLLRDQLRLGLVGARSQLVQEAVRIRLQPRDLGQRVPGRRRRGDAGRAHRGRRWSRSGTARRGATPCLRMSGVCARRARTSPGRGPRSLRASRACGSSAPGARGDTARRARRTSTRRRRERRRRSSLSRFRPSSSMTEDRRRTHRRRKSDGFEPLEAGGRP